MGAVLFGAVWASVALFVVGEAGKREWRRTGVEPRWAWPAWTAGALLGVAHSLVALASRYGWDHDRAVAATAAQTAAVFGLAWGGGVYVNYIFMAAWIGEAIWWKRSPAVYAAQPPALTAILRAFYFAVLVNAAVVFAAPGRRPLGLLLMACLVLVWARPIRRASHTIGTAI